MDMNNEKTIIEVDSIEQVVDIIKLSISKTMRDAYETLLTVEPPKEEDFASFIEYKMAYQDFMVKMVEGIKDFKQDCFKGLLSSYNNFLTNKLEMNQIRNQEYLECIERMDGAKSDIKRTAMVGVGLTLLFPKYFPIIVVVNLSRIGIDAIVKSTSNYRIYKNQILTEQMNKIQLPFYELTNQLREDYHESNKELMEIKQRALEGKNIIGQLLPLVSLERLSLPNPDDFLLENKMEKEKLLIKK